MELIVGKNSYITLEEAEQLMSEMYLDTDDQYVYWQGLSENNKKVLIARGTKIVDNEEIKYKGVKVDKNQDMQFPRDITDDMSLSTDNNILDCPKEIKEAILELIINKTIDSGSEEEKLRRKGVQSYKIKDASISFFDSDKNVNGNSSNTFNISSDIWNRCFAKYSNICM